MVSFQTEPSSTKRIIAFRNRLVHRYADTADDIVWGIVQSDVPTLRREVQALLSRTS